MSKNNHTKTPLSRRGFLAGATVGSVGAFVAREAIGQEFIDTGLTLDDLEGEWWLTNADDFGTDPVDPVTPPDEDEPLGTTPTPPVEETLAIRRDIYTLAEGGREIQSLRRGIAEMKRRSFLDPRDPTGWFFQAAIHGGQVGSQVQRCQHANRFFLSWHRMYLYYFERILRAASGDDTLTLPYWDYSIPGRASLPPATRFPNNADQNPLYWPTRHPYYNGGGALPSNIVEVESTLRANNFDGALGFNRALESQPHNGVHVQIGGSMASVNDAGQDPIFWLHHCNIDRQWNRWLSRGGPRQNPSDLEFLSQRYNFYTESGQLVSIVGEDILDTQNLGYRYDDDPAQPPVVSAFVVASAPPPDPQSPFSVGLESTRPNSTAPAPAALAAAAPQPIARRASATLAEAAPDIRLGGGKTKVSLRVSGPAPRPQPIFERNSVSGASTDPNAPQPSASIAAAPVRTTDLFVTESAAAEVSPVVLQLQDIAFEKSPGVFNIFVNLPEGTPPDPRGPYYAGYFAPFSQNQTDAPESFDITGLLNRQVGGGLWDGSEIDVQFIAIDPAGQVTNVVRDPLSIGQIRIIRE